MCMYTFIYVYAYQLYICICIYIHMYSYTRCIYLCIYTYKLQGVSSMRLHIYIYIYIYIYAVSTYTYIYICIIYTYIYAGTQMKPRGKLTKTVADIGQRHSPPLRHGPPRPRSIRPADARWRGSLLFRKLGLMKYRAGRQDGFDCPVHLSKVGQLNASARPRYLFWVI